MNNSGEHYFNGNILNYIIKTYERLVFSKFKEASVEFLNNAEYKAAVKSGSGVAKRMEDVANAIKMEALKKKEI